MVGEARGLAATCYTENMFRYVNAAIRIVFFGLATLGVLAWEHPYVAAGVIAFFVAFYYADKGDQKRLAATADLRAMSPTEYEQHCAELLRQAGWTVRHLGGIGDQGVDVIAELRGTKAALQCKKYVRAVGNAAVQQVVAGKRHHGAQVAVVVSPASYTWSARQLAKSNGVHLLNHGHLADLERIARIPPAT